MVRDAPLPLLAVIRWDKRHGERSDAVLLVARLYQTRSGPPRRVAPRRDVVASGRNPSRYKLASQDRRSPARLKVRSWEERPRLCPRGRSAALQDAIRRPVPKSGLPHFVCHDIGSLCGHLRPVPLSVRTRSPTSLLRRSEPVGYPRGSRQGTRNHDTLSAGLPRTAGRFGERCAVNRSLRGAKRSGGDAGGVSVSSELPASSRNEHTAFHAFSTSQGLLLAVTPAPLIPPAVPLRSCHPGSCPERSTLGCRGV